MNMSSTMQCKYAKLGLISLALLLFCTDVVFANDNLKKPNIVIIMADDVGTGDIPFYWNSSLVEMPNIKNLSAKGVTFTDAHSTPLCSPSRYMLLSGNYAHRGVYPRGSWNLNRQGNNQFLGSQKSIAEVLREEANYATAMFGKWHMGAGVPRNGKLNKTHVLTAAEHDWSQPLIDGPQDIGFDASVITVYGIQKHPYAWFNNGYLDSDSSDAAFWEVGNYSMPHGTSIVQKNKSGEGEKDWDSSAYNMIVVNETQSFIEDHLRNNGDAPFFAYVALGTAHEPHSPPDEYLDGTKVADVYQTRHMDMLLEMDKAVGTIVDLIETKNLAEDTIIIFTSDNGGLGPRKGTDPALGHHSSGPLRGSKGELW